LTRKQGANFCHSGWDDYPAGDLAGIELARRIGNVQGGLPYTVIVDRNGKIVTTQLGTFSTEKLEGIIKPLL
jgi:hypothetical protein